MRRAYLLVVLGLAAAFVRAGEPGWNVAPADFARYSVLTPSGPEEPDPQVFAKIKRLVYASHKVQKGEYSAFNLAKTYNTTSMSLQTTNNDELILLYPGKRVTVHNKDGMLYEVKKGSETLDAIVNRFKRGPAERKAFKESVVIANKLPGSALLDEFTFDKGDRILLPKISMAFDTYRIPVDLGGMRISSRYGYRTHPITKRKKFHEGMDIPKPWGSPVYPARSGTVVEAGWHGGYGQLITIRHSDGFTTRYGHLSKIMVTVGQFVHRGKTMIGRVGSTGLSTGPHLHWEVRDRNGKPHNPGAKIGRR